MTDISTDARKLVEEYNILLELYNRLEVISNDIFEALKDRSQFGIIQAKLMEKIEVVEAIQEQSQKISAMKKNVRFSEVERAKVKRAEEKLTAVVNHAVALEDRSRDLFQKQGVKISRI